MKPNTKILKEIRTILEMVEADEFAEWRLWSGPGGLWEQYDISQCIKTVKSGDRLPYVDQGKRIKAGEIYKLHPAVFDDGQRVTRLDDVATIYKESLTPAEYALGRSDGKVLLFYR